jgi:hypothetical protein
MESINNEHDRYYPMKTYIHVNQHKIRANKKHGTNEPVITIKKGRENTYCHEVRILGDSIVRYGGNDSPILSCGARVVIETEAEVEVVK